MAQGFAVAEPHKKALAFVGDSTFFASGLTGIVNAVYNGHDITVCVLDNATTAMTGSQPHPGTGVTLMGPRRTPVSIERVLEALGVECIVHANPLDLEGSIAAAREAIEFAGPSAILFESPCVQLVKPGAPAAVDADTCTGCKKCITEIGCPAIGFNADARGPRSKERGQAFVDPSPVSYTHLTMRNLMGFIRPDSGTARIGGLDCFRDRAPVSYTHLDVYKRQGDMPPLRN